VDVRELRDPTVALRDAFPLDRAHLNGEPSIGRCPTLIKIKGNLAWSLYNALLERLSQKIDNSCVHERWCQVAANISRSVGTGRTAHRILATKTLEKREVVKQPFGECRR
jgi:hypothetical protein